MTATNPTPPRWIVARLGDDLNWWIHETSQELDADQVSAGLLDPRQVAHLAEALADYQSYGLQVRAFAAAFQSYLLESELSDGRVRLALAHENLASPGEQLFALPLIAAEGRGAYFTFLDALSAAHIRLLNATHRYSEPLTELEMTEELQALDADRYFSGAAVHVFDELNEILQWRPPEWDEPGD